MGQLLGWALVLCAGLGVLVAVFAFLTADPRDGHAASMQLDMRWLAAALAGLIGAVLLGWISAGTAGGLFFVAFLLLIPLKLLLATLAR